MMLNLGGIFLESSVLLQWVETIQEWSSDIKLDRRHVWLAVGGVPLQAWSKHTFKNIAEVWGSLVYIDKDMSTPTSFEQACVQEIYSLFWNEVDSDLDESVSEESVGNEEAQHDFLDQVSNISIKKTPTKTAGVAEESSTMDKLIANKYLLEVKRSLDLRVIDCSENATDGLLRDNRHILAAPIEAPTWSWDETVAIVDRVVDRINMGMNIDEIKQNPSMDIEQIERHTCSDRNAHKALLNKASDTEVIEYNWTLNKVRSVSNVVLSFMKPEERTGAEKKLKKKG
ncbi:hypothetical protein V6N12_074833 [Hibiscus sabdariffa]|uniref:DUF4283 domain-containing protein n=1 Tax=Hibiscus sabdariffa TaxID=183260 RepID=A0ABR2D2K3_9ROSI